MDLEMFLRDYKKNDINPIAYIADYLGVKRGRNGIVLDEFMKAKITEVIEREIPRELALVKKHLKNVLLFFERGPFKYSYFNKASTLERVYSAVVLDTDELNVNERYFYVSVCDIYKIMFEIIRYADFVDFVSGLRKKKANVYEIVEDLFCVGMLNSKVLAEDIYNIYYCDDNYSLEEKYVCITDKIRTINACDYLRGLSCNAGYIDGKGNAVVLNDSCGEDLHLNAIYGYMDITAENIDEFISIFADKVLAREMSLDGLYLVRNERKFCIEYIYKKYIGKSIYIDDIEKEFKCLLDMCDYRSFSLELFIKSISNIDNVITIYREIVNRRLCNDIYGNKIVL